MVCGDMAGERGFFENAKGVTFKNVDGYDLSPQSVERYKPNNINFFPHICDVNEIILEKNKYHLIVGIHGIHHIYKLANVFFQMHKSLKNKGLIYLDEWIGPNFLQIPLHNHIIASLLLIILFPIKKKRTNHEGMTKGLWIQYAANCFDPSEACNSEKLYPNFKRFFKPITIVKYGGLLYPVFDGLGQNFYETSILDKIRVRFVYFLERLLIKMRVIKPLFMGVIAEKKL